MKFSIITPIYNAQSEHINKYFNALSQQCNNIDFNVILINDGGEIPSIPHSNFPVYFLSYATNRGPGVARQTGINYCIQHQLADYIIFCDIDDYFQENGLNKYYDVLHNFLNLDIIYPKLLICGNKNIDNEFPDSIHGLCVSVDYISKYNITFPKSHYHEDGLYTLKLAQHNPIITSLNDAVLVHTYNNNSYSYFTYEGLYLLSMMCSIVDLYQSLQDTYLYEAQTDNILIEALLNRLSFFSNYKNVLQKEDWQVINFIISCVWRYLPMITQEEYLNNTQVILYNQTELSNIYSQIQSYICLISESDIGHTKIREYLLNNLETLYQLSQKDKYNGRKKCTIIVPTYNNINELPPLLTRFENSSCADALHVLVINDGSTTDLPNLNTIFKKASFELITLSNNRGVGTARQIGFDLVNTEYFFLVDADDQISNEYVIEHFIDWLDHYPDVFAVRGWERYLAKKKPDDPGTVIVVNDNNAYESYSIHGMMGRTSTLKQYHLFMPQIQYAEDGVFVDMLSDLRLNYTVLPFIAYDKQDSHLTNSVYSPFANFIAINDNYQHIYYKLQRYKEIPNEYLEEYLIMLEALLLVTEDILTGESCDPDTQRAHLFSWHHDPIHLEQLQYYYGALIINLIPSHIMELLCNIPMPKFKTDCTFLQQLYQKDTFYLSKSQHDYTFEELEQSVQQYITNLYEKNKDQYYIPHQAFKHFPWNYKFTQ